ncbi:HEPN domain-containing protein [Candidatus Poribacteria bacterium]|nr:HEPN domain-containing protein [Candidatus Poribacteria bacterium]
MNPLTLEWVKKAEGDYTTVMLLQPSPISSKDVICFYAQQCIEKYLKAWWQESNIPIPRTHNLEDLLNLIISSRPSWGSWKSDFSTLTKHAVDFRYPGRFATAEDAAHAIEICVKVREVVREALKLPQDQLDR